MMGSAMLLQSFSQADLRLPVPGLSTSGLPLPLHALAQSGFSIAVSGCARLGSSLLALDFLQLELLLPLRSLARSGFACFVASGMRPGSFLFLRTPLQLGFSLLMSGVACVEPFLLVVDSVHLEFLMPSHHFVCLACFLSMFGLACVGPPIFAPDMALVGSLLLLRSPSYLDFTSPSQGLLLLMADSTSLGLLVPLQASCQCGFSTPPLGVAQPEILIVALDFAQSGFLLLLQSALHTGLFVALLGMARPFLSLLVLDSLSSGSSLFLRSFSRLEFAVFVLDLNQSDALSLPRSRCRLGFSLAPMGISRTDLPVLVSSSNTLETPMSLRCFVWSGSMLLLRGNARLGRSLLLLEVACSGAPLFSRSSTCLEFILLALGTSKLGLSPFAVDLGISGVSTFSRSLSRLDAVLSLRGTSSPSLRTSSRIGLTVLILGSGCCGLSLFAFDFLLLGSPTLLQQPAHLDFASLIHGLARAGALPAALDHAKVEASLFTQSLTRMDFLMFVSSLLRTGAFMSVSDSAQPGLFVFLHGLSCLEPGVLVLGMVRFNFLLILLDSSQLGLSSPVRSLSRTGLTSFARSVCRFGLPLPLLDWAAPGSPFAHSDFGLLMTGDATVGLLSVRHVAHLGSLLFVFGMNCFDSSLPVLDLLHLGLSLFLRSFSYLASVPLTSDFSRFGSPSVLRSLTCLEASMSSLGIARLGSMPLVGGNVHPGGAIYFNGPSTYVQYDTGATELRVHAGGLKRLSISSTGGSLHGTWSSESIISASDERLKRRIEPLERTLAARALSSPGDVPGSDRAKAVGWLLRELRPVSYHFKTGPEAKLARPWGYMAAPDAYNLFRGAMVKPRFADRGGAKGAECCGLCHTGPHSLARGISFRKNAIGLIPIMTARVPCMTPKQIALCAWGLGRTLVHEEQAWAALGGVVCSQAKEFSLSDIAMFSWGLAAVDRTAPAEILALKQAVRQKLLGRSLKEESSHDLCMLLKAMSKLTPGDQRFLQWLLLLIFEAMEEKTIPFAAQGTTSIWSALAMLKWRPEDQQLEVLCEESRQLRLDHTFNQDMAAEIARALLVLDVKDPRPEYQIADYVARKGLSLRSDTLLVLAEFFAARQVSHDLAWKRLGVRVQQRGIDLALQDIERLVAAFRRAGRGNQRIYGMMTLFLRLREDQAKYGFIAQELEKDKKHVVYQDLVALLTLASQVQQDRLEDYEARARKRAEKLKDQDSLLAKLRRAVARLAGRITRWEDSMRPRSKAAQSN
eukprot:symbB.v1.2.021121.t2/scaffold1808.1/size103924/13